ncbi:MAG: glycosyltransferase family 2 protein [Brachymonas sp.]
MTETTASLDQVTVVIVTYNSRHCIADLARALATFPHVFISDNASEDGTTQAVRDALPQAQVLVHETNLGFGAANNRALAQVTTPFAFLLNPDCEARPDAVLSLLDYLLQDVRAAVAAPQIMRSHGAAEISYRWPSILWPAQGAQAEGPCCVGFVTGAALLLRMAYGQDLGFFVEDFFLYYEDEDLCLRLFQAQRAIVVVPSVRLTHASRGSVRGQHPVRAEFWRGFHHVQSKILFAHKHRSAQTAQRLMTRTWALACLGLPLRLLLPAPRMLARWCGRIAGAWGMRGRLRALSAGGV